MVVDIGEVKRHIKPKADSTLYNMRKADLIEYVRTLEHNYNVAVSFNENQAKYIDQLQTTAFVAGCNWGYGVDLSAHVSEQEQLGAQSFLGKITTEEALHRRKALFGGDC